MQHGPLMKMVPKLSQQKAVKCQLKSICSVLTLLNHWKDVSDLQEQTSMYSCQ